MAQTKKKRRSKHRGNAAGVVEARGRTGRKPGGERKLTEKELAAKKRHERFMRPPSWKSAATRAGLAAAVFGVLLLFAFGQEPAQAITLTVFVFFFYVPLGYYTDALIYKRRMKSEAKKKPA